MKVRRGGMTGGSHSWESGAYLKVPRWFQCCNDEASVIRCSNQRSIIISGLRGWQVQLEWFPTRYGGHNIFLIFCFQRTKKMKGRLLPTQGKWAGSRRRSCLALHFPLTQTVWELSEGSTAFASRQFREGRLIYLMYMKGLRTGLPKMYSLDMWIISN